VSNETRKKRVRAFLIDWLIWAYVPTAIIYLYREQLEDYPHTLWLYLGALALGLIVSLVTERSRLTVGERIVGLHQIEEDEGETYAKGPPWYCTLVGWTIAVLVVVTLVLGWNITEINLYYLFTRAENMRNMTDRLLRPYWPVAGTLLEKLIETIFLALMSTAFAVPIAALVSFLAARNLMYQVTAEQGTILGGAVGGVVGAVVGVRLVRWVLPSLESTNLDIPLLTGILTPLFWLVGLIFVAYLGAKFTSHVSASENRSLSRVVGALLSGALGVGFAYALASLISMLAFAASWQIFVRDYGAWPNVVLGLGGLVGVALSVNRDFSEPFPIGRLIYEVVRFVLNATRSVEPFVWALIFVTWFRLGPFPGTVALTVHSIAALGKLYSEQIEGIDPGPVEAVRATGASDLQTIVYAVVPQIIPPFISFTIYRWDINVRMSTIIGLVGGGGIGQMLFQYQNLGQWRQVSVAVILIVAIVMTLDQISARVRERIM